jgi:hypothetical protein
MANGIGSQTNDDPHNKAFSKAIIALRALFVTGIALLVTGSCFIGNYNDPSEVSKGVKFAKAGYLVIACVLAVVVSFTALIRIRGWAISMSSIKVYSKGPFF